MEGFRKIESSSVTMMVRPEAVSAVAPVPGEVKQVQVIIDGVPIVVPLTVQSFMDQLAGKPAAGGVKLL